MRSAAAGKAVMLGAGNVGRGFIGQLLCQWGFDIIFVDIDEQLVSQINEYRQYPIILLSDTSEQTFIVRNVSALNGRQTDKVAQAIAGADLMAISVGAGALPAVMGQLAQGIRLRCNRQGPPLNILICENLMDARPYISKLLLEQLSGQYAAYFNENIGLVETSIGRMIPVQTPQMKQFHPLSIHAESFCELPVDKAAFKGAVLKYPHMKPYSPFSFYVQRKMYIHNMGHTAVAYLGNRKGYTFIWEAVLDSAIRETVTQAMLESARALNKAYNVPFPELEEHVLDLLSRFGNKKLGDTIARVGRDLPRKLGENERFFGAARFCAAQGVENKHILKSLQAALGLEDDEKTLTLGQLRKIADKVILDGGHTDNA